MKRHKNIKYNTRPVALNVHSPIPQTSSIRIAGHSN